ncbi:MAG: alcohol dehydrogenase catalytic domain-containing protein [Vicinamibacteria bacterium]
MKALTVVARKRAEIVEIEDPEPGPGEVSVAISHVGLCGTDLHVFEGVFGRFPMIPGHDAVGRVVAAGGADEAALMGRLVTIDPSACCLRAARPTPLCPACLRGATNLCDNQSYMGISAPGACSERVVIPSARAVPVPDEVDPIEATCLEPLAVALHLQARIADVPGEAAVFGAGPVGLAIARVLAHNRSVSVIETSEARRAFARAEGCERVFSPELLPLPLPPILIDAAGHPSVAPLIERHAGPSTLIILVGGPLDIPGRTILTQELEIRAVKGGRGLYPEALDLLRRGFDTSRWTETILSLNEAPEFFAQWSAGTRKPFRAAIRLGS